MIRRLVWLLGQSRRNRGWRDHARRFAEVAAMDRDTYRAWKSAAVREHLAWARASVPFFRDLPEGADSLADWPVLARADVQRYADSLRDATRPESELMRNASGGSTGQPVVVYQDRDYWVQEFALEAWLSEWWGIKPWSRLAYLWGDDLNPEDHTWKARLERRLAGELILNVFDIDDAKVAAFADTLRRKKPEVIMGYASALELFGAHLEKTGGLGYTPALLRSAAEAVDADRRERIERGFGMPLTDFYGSRESASLAAQWHDGRYYVMGHAKVVEVVDDDGHAVAPGVPGRVLVTDLTNRAFGMIRYEIGDVASFAAPAEDGTGAPCPFPCLERIHGRTSDFITTPTGGRIHGEFFTHLFYGVTSVTSFQVRQTAVDALDVLTVGPADEDVMDPILAKIREQMGDGVDVRWRAVDEIPLTRTGKHRFTVSEVSFRGSGV